MYFIRSLIFNFLFYTATATLAIVFLPFLFSKTLVQYLGKVWGYICILTLFIVGISHKCIGNKNLDKQVIYAVKHQSEWETIVLYFELNAPIIVIKMELLKIPFLGWFFKKAGSIAIDRAANKSALKFLIRQSQIEKLNGKSILIFPQGTRVRIGEKKSYKSGIFSIYKASGLPVIPVALNSGKYWSKNNFFKYPGIIKVKFLKEIKPGFDRSLFMKNLENVIEEESSKLEKE